MCCSLCHQHLVWSNPSEEHWLWFNAVGIYLYCESISKYYALLLVSTSYVWLRIIDSYFFCVMKRDILYWPLLYTKPVVPVVGLVLFAAPVKDWDEQIRNLSHLGQPILMVLRLSFYILFLGQLCGSLAVFYLMFSWCTIWYLPYSEIFNQTCWCSYYIHSTK